MASRGSSPLRFASTHSLSRIAIVRAIAFALLAATSAAAQSTDSAYVIHAATLLDGRGGSRRDASVIVRGSKIERIANGPVRVAGARVIELGTATLIPGL